MPETFPYTSGNYDQRSLQHERRMIAVYRQQALRGEALQPLANACWRAASFEWVLYGDRQTVRQLWAEGARALALGFSKRGATFDPSPDQYILCLHLALAASGERDALAQALRLAPNLRDGALRNAQAFRHSRTHFHLAEAYALTISSVVARRAYEARLALSSAEAALATDQSDWWEGQYPSPLEAAWHRSEHLAVCEAVRLMARALADQGAPPTPFDRHEWGEELARTMDRALESLLAFVQSSPNHHPKLYVWLPGIALCNLATQADLAMEWLATRSELPSYQRLPLPLLTLSEQQ
ncbi:hypothetical protein [Pyrinomonas sp.]|uniref:hypothetical protein n=1 Tax=Pyrinomonas sp. TaxID=2080306 RepID=UPI003333F1D4